MTTKNTQRHKNRRGRELNRRRAAEGARKSDGGLSGGLSGGSGGREKGRGGLAGEFAFPEPSEEDGDGEEGDDVEDHAADVGEHHGLHELGAAAGGPEDGDEREEGGGVGPH